MAQVTIKMIKELRERTSAGMSDCKGALVEAEGDMEKAVEVILKKGLAKSAKRAGAATTEGVVAASVGADSKSGAIVEVNIQTDFAARNENFLAFVDNVLAVAAKTPADAALADQPYPGSEKTVDGFRQELAAKIGENIIVRRNARFDVAEAGLVHSYVHMGGKVGVLLELQTATADLAGNDAVKSFADDVAMQIAAMNAQYLTQDDVPADTLAAQQEIFKAQLAEANKPEKAWPKIIEGKTRKWYTEVTLMAQESVMVSGSTILQLQEKLSKDVGGAVALKGFARFERGEGLEKKEENFADEVAKKVAES